MRGAMNFDEAVCAGRPAFNWLESGQVLGYEPKDRTVRMLPYPATPGAWRTAPLYGVLLPEEGWGHHCGCSCWHCRNEATLTGLEE